jgi:hypothetical protein
VLFGDIFKNGQKHFVTEIHVASGQDGISQEYNPEQDK